jgi:hypothetical protein
MEKKERLIKVSPEVKKQIAEDFKVSIKTVCSALNFETNSAKAITLRAAARNRGGKLLTEEESKASVVL